MEISGATTVKIRSRLLTKTLTAAAYVAARLLFATCRKVYLTSAPRPRFDPSAKDDDPHRYIALVWHDSLLFPAFATSRTLQRRTCCLTSRHHDGDYIAELMAWLGIGAIRGSTNHGGAEAVRQLMEQVDKHIVITPDGPRGPRRRMKPGAAFLASQTGRQIVVMAFSCRRGWRLRGKWTDLLIPQPFTTIYLLAAAPQSVPPNLSRDELDRITQSLQESMDRLNAAADLLAQPSPPSRIEPHARAAA